MSGPKVVCIVTREEVFALCRNLLALVAEAAASLRLAAQRLGAQDDPVVMGLNGRLQQLEAMLGKDQFRELQRAAPGVMAFLEGERRRLETAAVERREVLRRRGRRLADAARSVIDTLTAAGGTPDAALLEVRWKAPAAREDELAAMQGTVEAALRRLAPKASGQSAKSIELARRLAHGLEAPTLAEWLTDQQGSVDAVVDPRLERLLAEAQALDNPAAAAPYLARADAIAAETSYAQRALLTDSLMIDLARHRQERVDLAASAAKLRQARAVLGALDAPEAAAMAQRVERVIAKHGHDDRLADKALVLVETLMGQRAAHARRRAVLEGLAAMGYEVREGMATALAEKGRIVVRKPAATDYGIELGAPQGAARLQVRVVRDATSIADAGRDHAAETVWCAELERLRALLAAGGNELSVERATEPGIEPVKTVTFLDAPARSGAALPSTLRQVSS